MYCTNPSRFRAVIARCLAISFVLLYTQVRAQERITFFMNDALGSPVVALDIAGAPVWRGDYEPFGDLIAQTGTIPTDRRWLGTYFDAESGLLAMGIRYYHPSLGRFLSADPALVGVLPPMTAVSPARLNAYSYGMNNPLRFSDAKGAFAVESATLQRSKEFKEAARLVARTGEGSRILWALDFANVNVVIFDVALPVNADARTKIKKQTVEAVFGEHVHLPEGGEWDHLVMIDYDLVRQAYGSRRERIRTLAQTLYHELRHTEIAVENWPYQVRKQIELDDALDKYKRPSLDFHEREFTKQLKKLLP
jgi:RHS repeat-associated protein